MSENKELCLQEKYAPKGVCFGCGHANKDGLRIQSFVRGDKVVCTYNPKPFHNAFEGVLAGGVIGNLMDCHSNWTAAWHLMNKNGMKHPPCTVTAWYKVSFKRPTPIDKPIVIEAQIVSSQEDRAVTTAVLKSGDIVCAKCDAEFVAVKEGHPAYNRW